MTRHILCLLGFSFLTSSVFVGHDPEKNPSLACRALLQTMGHQKVSVVSDERVKRAREVLEGFLKESSSTERSAELVVALEGDRADLVMLNFQDGKAQIEKSLEKLSKTFRLMQVEKYAGVATPAMSAALGIYFLDAVLSFVGGGPFFRSAALATAGFGRAVQGVTSSTEGRVIESVGLGLAGTSFLMQGMNQLPMMSANIEVAAFLFAAAASRLVFPRLPRYVSDTLLLGAGATWLFLSGDENPIFLNAGLPLFVGGLAALGHGVYEFVDRAGDVKRIRLGGDEESFRVPEMLRLRAAALEEENPSPQHIFWDAALDKSLLLKLKASRWGRKNSSKISELEKALVENRSVLIKIDQVWVKSNKASGKSDEVLISFIRVASSEQEGQEEVGSSSANVDQSE